ncbi:MAG: alpha-amylase [Spirochaetaceae bacterium]|jgi:hypothetical protein|nr:alpha-amylase [Spirochaetaceae bacterium]
MTGKISLILGSRAHLSASAADDQFEELYRNKLKPFITTLNRHPKIPAVLYYSGALFHRLEQKKPELFLLIKELAARKQLEILGGGFYEPLMPLLPHADKIGQIEMFTTYIRQNFGRKPQGCFLAHSGWEQSLVGVLTTCGMAYTFLTEEQFTAAGAEHCYSPVYTEDQGKLLAVFPVFSSLAEMGSRGAFSVLKDNHEDKALSGGSKLVTVFPDFPRENAEERLESFFEDLDKTISQKTKDELSLELTTPGRVYRTSASLSRLYFFASGDSSCSHPRSLLASQMQANDLYATIYFVHNLINQFRGDKSRKRAAREELWKAQEADALCGGYSDDRNSGGHNNRRNDGDSMAAQKHAYRAVLTAERIIREKDFIPSLLSFDLNLDGAAEYLFQDKNTNCYVSSRGAAVFEFDYLPKGWSYLNAFPDGKVHHAFRDILLPGDFVPLKPSAINEANLPTGSRLCGNEEYRMESADRTKLKASFTLPTRKGIPFGLIEIQKIYRLEKNTLYLSYLLRNKSEEKIVLRFIPRFDLSLAGEELLFRKSQGEEERSAEKQGEKKRVVFLEEQESKQGASIGIGFQSPCDLYYYPAEPGHQSLCFFPVFQLFLNPGDTWENRITVAVSAKARSAKN